MNHRYVSYHITSHDTVNATRINDLTCLKIAPVKELLLLRRKNGSLTNAASEFVRAHNGVPTLDIVRLLAHAQRNCGARLWRATVAPGLSQWVAEERFCAGF